jgi:hypothetical protein
MKIRAFTLGLGLSGACGAWASHVIQQAMRGTDFTLAAPPRWHSPSPTDPACVQNRMDPGDVGAVAPEGKFKGQCIETQTRRPVTILTPEEYAPYRLNVGPDDLVLGNVSCHGKHWVMVYPKGRLKMSDVYLEKFNRTPPVIAHLARFLELTEPALLVPQAIGDADAPLRMRHFVESGEAVPLRGAPRRKEKLLFIYGMRKRDFVVANRLVCADDKAVDMVEGLHRKIKLLPEKSEIGACATESFLRQGARDGFGRMYQDQKLNCYVALKNSYEACTPVAKSLGQKLAAALRRAISTIPGLTPLMMRASGYRDPRLPVRSFNELARAGREAQRERERRQAQAPIPAGLFDEVDGNASWSADSETGEPRPMWTVPGGEENK